ncbi:MAG: hypothetical protein ABI723_10055 [Bacteroidia bacterium]
MKPVIYLLLSSIFFSFTFIEGEWVTIKSEKEGYKISFPKKPEEQSQNVPSDVGELKMNMWICEVDSTIKDDNLVYLFNYTDYPEKLFKESDSSLTAGILDGAVNGGVKNVKGKLISVENETYKNYPGRNARIDYNDGQAIITMKCYMVKNRIYLLEIITLTQNDKNADMKKFIDSFELLN